MIMIVIIIITIIIMMLYYTILLILLSSLPGWAAGLAAWSDSLRAARGVETNKQEMQENLRAAGRAFFFARPCGASLHAQLKAESLRPVSCLSSPCPVSHCLSLPCLALPCLAPCLALPFRTSGPDQPSPLPPEPLRFFGSAGCARCHPGVDFGRWRQRPLCSTAALAEVRGACG